MVIPVYRAEGVLPELFERLTTTLRTIGRLYEIILVDDGSPDGSWPVVRDFAAASDNVTGVLLSCNFGQHQAISAGLDLAKGEWTVVMDCDLQDPPEDIPRLLDAAEGGYDVVLARRSARYGTPVKRVTSALFYRVFSVLSGYHMDQSVGTFRIMHRTVVDAVQSMPESPRLFGGLVRWVGFATGYVDVERAERPNRKSAYGWSQLIKLALDGIVAFSNRPLYISISIGITMSFLSAAYGLFLVINFLIDRRVGVPGWLSTMTSLGLHRRHRPLESRHHRHLCRPHL